MFLSSEKRLRFVILALVISSILIFFIYHQIVLRNAVNSESEQKLFQVGKNYEFQVKSEIKRFYSLSEFIALSLSKNMQSSDFIYETKNLFRDLIYRNSRLQSIELVLKTQETKIDTSGVILSLMNEPGRNSFKLVKLKSGKIEEEDIGEFSSTKLKVAIERTGLSEQTRLLPPEIVLSENQSQTVIPVLSGIFSGQQFLGYVILNISVEWMGQTVLNEDNLEDYIEIFIASPDGKILSLNKNNILKAEPIERVCLSCKNLLGNKGREYNVVYMEDNMTLCVPWNINDNKNYWHICLRIPTNELHGAGSYDNWFSWLVAAALIALCTFFSFFFYRKYSGNWDSLIQFANQIQNGTGIENEKARQNLYTGRFSELNASLISISKLMAGIYHSNKAALKGDFSMQFDQESLQNHAVSSTKEIHDHLKMNAQKLERESSELALVRLHNSGMGKIETVLKSHHVDLNQLSIQVVHALVDLLQIEMGAIFLRKSEEGEQFLEMIVSYAYSENRFQKRRFKFGESLVGACAAEKRTIVLKKIPDDYLKIISGLGLASPKSIILVPLIFSNEVLGVLELGSLKDFDDSKISFTERAAESIASTITLTEEKINSSDLLEKSSQQTIEIEVMDLKLNETLAEMNQMQLKASRNEALIRAKIDAMNNTLMMVEYTTNGIVIDANYKYLSTMNYSIEDIKGIDVMELLKEADRAELNKIIQIVKNGNFYEAILKRPTRHGVEKWLMATYSPVFDENNIVKSILFFAVDISRLRQNELQLKLKSEELTEQVNELRQLLENKPDK